MPWRGDGSACGALALSGSNVSEEEKKNGKMISRDLSERKVLKVQTSQRLRWPATQRATVGEVVARGFHIAVNTAAQHKMGLC